MTAVLTLPEGPSGLAGRPLIENANAPALPTRTITFSRTSCLSLSPACIRRATVTFPSAVILTQQSPVASTSSANPVSTPDGRPAPVVATGAGDFGAVVEAGAGAAAPPGVAAVGAAAGSGAADADAG